MWVLCLMLLVSLFAVYTVMLRTSQSRQEGSCTTHVVNAQKQIYHHHNCCAIASEHATHSQDLFEHQMCFSLNLVWSCSLSRGNRGDVMARCCTTATCKRAVARTRQQGEKAQELKDKQQKQQVWAYSCSHLPRRRDENVTGCLSVVPLESCWDWGRGLVHWATCWAYLEAWTSLGNAMSSRKSNTQLCTGNER